MTHEAVSERKISVARGIGVFCLSNATLVLAAFTALIYGVGLLRTLAQLHAEHVQSLRGLPLAPLQVYFVAGLAVILKPTTMIVLAIVLGLAAFAHAGLRRAELDFSRPAPDQPTRTEQHESPADEDDADRPGVVEIAAFSMLVVVWLVAVLGAVLVVAQFVPLRLGAAYVTFTSTFVLLFLSVRSIAARSPDTSASLFTAALVTGLTLATLAFTYVEPPSLDRVTIRATNGRYVRAKLLSQTSSMVYVVGPRRPKDRNASIIAFPTSRIARMEIDQGGRRRYRTVAEAPGIRIRGLQTKLPPLLKP